MPASILSSESHRLEILRTFEILDTPAELEYDELTRLAAQICGTPIAAISLLDDTRQWFKSRVGLTAEQTPRKSAFCAYTLNSPDLLIVPDALADPRFAKTPLVKGEPFIRFYAGSPLVTPEGAVLGTLCVIDRVPRHLSADQQQALGILGRQVMARLQLRRQLREQQSLAAQLAAEKARLLEVQAVANVGSWATDLKTYQVEWSEQTHRIFETPPDTFQASHPAFLALVHPDDRAAVDDAFRRSFHERTTCAIEHRILLPDGRIKFLEERWRSFQDGDGTPIRAVGTCRDITKQKLSNEERDRLFNLSLDMLCVASFEGWFLQLNPAWTECLGWSRTELTSRPSLEFVHPGDRAATQITRAKAAAGEAIRGFENRYLCKDGSFRWLSWNVHPLPESRQVFSVARDVTAAREREKQLRLLEHCVQRLNDIVLITEADPIDEPGPRILFVNDAFVRITGFTREEAIGHSPRMLQGAATQRAVLDRIRKALKERRPIREELINYRKSGEKYWLELDIVPVADAAGNLTHSVAIERDITERKQIEDNLQEYAALLRASEEKYRLLFADNPQPMWVFDFHSLRFLAVNAAAVQRYGYTERQFLAMTITDIRSAEEAAVLKRDLKRAPHVGRRNLITRHRKSDGTLLDVEISSENIVFEGIPARLVVASDISQRMQAERAADRAKRALHMLTRCNEALVRATSENELLSAVCQIAVEVGDARMAWVGYVTEGTPASLEPRAQAGFEAGFLKDLQGTWAIAGMDCAEPSAEAVRTAEPVIVSDFAGRDTLSPWRASAQAKGFTGVICLPLKDRGRVLGLLALYLSEVRDIPPDELHLLQEMADDLTFGILALRSQIERRKTQDAVLTMARGISSHIGSEFFGELALCLTEALGAHVGSVVEIDPKRDGHAKTLALVVGGKLEENLTYELTGSPCEHLDRAEVWVVPRNVPRLYPQSHQLTELKIEAYVGTRLLDAAGGQIGLMFAGFQRPLEQQEFVCSTLKIFAARATAELERQKVDAKTREQAALIDQSRDAIVVQDLAHRITFWNQGAERLYRWTAAEAVGRHFSELLPSTPDQFAEAERMVISSGEWNGEVQKRDRTGAALTLDARWTLLRDALGNPQSILTVESDVTERKRVELQFLRAQRMESIGTLAGGIAHDLNNLLAPIVMGVGLLKVFGPTPQTLPIIESIETSATRGARLVKQVLSFARGVEGARVALNLEHIIREVEAIAESSFPKNLEFETNTPADLWLILGDPTQLNQVILNLCVNARDAMPGGGRIEVAADNIEIDQQYAKMNRGMFPGRYVRVRVTDDGCGIPPEVIDRIFDPFYTTKEVGKGTGLGLSTAQGIIRSHGGFISVYSDSGKGSTFKVYLPAMADGAALEIAQAAEEKLPRGNGELILVVDDESTIVDITTQTLQAFGYRTISAEDGAAAIALYAQRKDEIAAVITDMMMPVVDGPALIIALNRLNPEVRIIAASGLAANSTSARAVNAGVKQFLPKPYSADILLRELKKVLTVS